MKGGLNVLVLALAAAFVVGCSSYFDKAPVADAGVSSGVSSQGVGEQRRFSETGSGESYSTKAPSNQVYLFAFDNSVLADKYLEALNAQARYLVNHPGARVVLAGHTDSRGSREYNIALGERRANTVANRLRLAGVAKRQVRVLSYGEERPAVYGDDEASYRLNRRVELTYEAIR